MKNIICGISIATGALICHGQTSSPTPNGVLESYHSKVCTIINEERIRAESFIGCNKIDSVGLRKAIEKILQTKKGNIGQVILMEESGKNNIIFKIDIHLSGKDSNTYTESIYYTYNKNSGLSLELKSDNLESAVQESKTKL